MLTPADSTILVDLSASGHGIIRSTATLFFDHNSVPVELELNLSSLDQDIRIQALSGRVDDILGGAPVSIRLPDGQEINATLEIVSNTNFNSAGEIVARCLISRVHSGKHEQHAEGSWRFSLTNVKLRICDISSVMPAPPSVPEQLRGWRLDKIAFTIAGRGWLLKDEMCGQWKNQRDRDVHVPVISATITTAAQATDTAEAVCDIADTIAAILTLALARSVRAVKVEHLDTHGNCNWWSVRDLLAFPLSQSGFPAVDNWQLKTVKNFVEGAYPVVLGDRKWWLPTLDMFMQVHVNPYLETKAMILNVLADRIADKLKVQGQDAEIDPQLNPKLKNAEFQRSLHALLTGLSAEWTQDRTSSLISQIKLWNARPSFAEGIRRACDAVHLKPPPTKLLGTRHRLMHVGELHPADMTLLDYWKELDALVLLLILRMLDYEGFVYAAKFGASEILLKDYLEPAKSHGPDPMSGQKGPNG